MTVRLSGEVKSRLEKLAEATDRTKAYLANRAIEEYLDAQEWQVQAIEEAVHEADRPGALFIEHAQVRAKLKESKTSTAKKKAR